MLSKAQRVDATNGSILRLIIVYTVPLILSTLIQTLFTAVDIVVLGNMATSSAVAAVGATSSIIHLIVMSFVGLSAGTKVILSRQVGAGDEEGAKNTVDTSLLTGFGIGVLVLIFSLFLSPLFLNMTNCPEDCYDGALLYIRIFVLSAPALMIYNFGVAILNAVGETKRPMMYIMACGVLNAILNIILCLILPQKVAAVAIATAASQFLGAFLVIRRLRRLDGVVKLILSKMRWDFLAFRRILHYGLPIALSNALFPLANLQIQSAINSYGVSAVAGNSGAATIEGICSATTGSFGSTAATFMGQNLGAEQHDRVRASFRNCLWMCLLCSGLFGVFMFLTGRFWLSLIVAGDAEAIRYGMIRLFFVTLFMFVSGYNTVTSHAIQAFGYSVFPAANSIACVFGFRVLWMTFVYPYVETFYWLMACYLVSWVLMLIFNTIGFCVVYARFKKGRFKRI